MEIRELHERDLATLLALYAQLEASNDDTVDQKYRDLWDSIKKNDAIHYIGAVDKGKVVSTCYCVIIPNLTRKGRPICYIENVVTHMDYRNQGLGRKVMERAIQIAKEHDCFKVILQSGNKRDGAHEFYRKLGFDDNTKIAFDMRL